MTLTAGEQLGPYRILAPIGAGGMGEVYRARDTKLDRDVAIKTLPASSAADAERLARLAREAKLLASLNHTNIAQVYGFEEQGGVRALVMELVEGPTLAHRVARGPIPIDDSVAIAKQIADGLQAAHERGIVHRDLKPANVKLRADGVVKILDFGLGKTLEAPGAPQATPSESPTLAHPLTREGAILGTAAYMSPEQARGDPADARADIWALGCVLYEMLTGRGAFVTLTTAETLVRVLEHDPSWEALPAGTPTSLRLLLRRCLEKDPRRRLHAAADVRIELEHTLIGSNPGASVDSGASRATRTLVAWLAAVVALAAGGVALWTASRVGTAPPRLSLDVQTEPTSDAVSFVLSPDGRQLAFVALDRDTPQLWLRPLAARQAVRLEGTEGASQPFWAPDGRSLAFFADGWLKRLDLAGGRPRMLAHARNPYGGAWSRGDVILYAPFAASPLLSVAASGGTPSVASRLSPGEVSHRFPSFLPDGRRFLFLVWASSPEKEGVYLGSLDSPDRLERLPLTDSAADFVAPGYLLSVRRDRELVAVPFDVVRARVSGDAVTVVPRTVMREGRGAFSASASGLLAFREGGEAVPASELVWVDRAGTVTRRLPGGGHFPSLAPDGRLIAAVQRTPSTLSNNDIWLVHAAGGSPKRFTFDPGFDICPTWSPDGRRLVFASNRNGVFDLFEKPAGFTRDERLVLGTPENKYPVDWSPDGRELLFVKESLTTGDDLWTLPLEEGAEPRPFLESSHSESQAQFSPDGRWVAYRSNASERWEIMLRPYHGSGSQQLVSRGGGIQPRWRRDGRELYYVGADGWMMAVPIRLPPVGDEVEIGTPLPLFRARLAVPGNQQFGYAVDPQGQRFVVSVREERAVTTPITVVQSWTAGLSR